MYLGRIETVVYADFLISFALPDARGRRDGRVATLSPRYLI